MGGDPRKPGRRYRQYCNRKRGVNKVGYCSGPLGHSAAGPSEEASNKHLKIVSTKDWQGRATTASALKVALGDFSSPEFLGGD